MIVMMFPDFFAAEWENLITVKYMSYHVSALNMYMTFLMEIFYL